MSFSSSHLVTSIAELDTHDENLMYAAAEEIEHKYTRVYIWL